MKLRKDVAEVSRILHERGWVANHDGNVTVRDGARYLATPTATSKRLITDRTLIELDAKGQVVGSREAALACDPWFVPVDAAIVGIVDGVDVPPKVAP